jgi:hypothetical protein
MQYIQQHAKKMVQRTNAKTLHAKALQDSITLIRSTASTTTLQTRLSSSLRLAR